MKMEVSRLIWRTVRWLSVLAFVFNLGGAIRAAEVAVKSGQTIAFLGDSITEGGWGNPVGYVRLVLAGLAANGVSVEGIPAGISGHKSDQMLARLELHVLSKHPDWMTLSCGVNDVWHGKNGIPLDQYKSNITEIVTRAQAAKVQVMILTATVIGEELDNENNRKLAPYNDFLRVLAREKHCLLADLNADFQARLKPAAAAGPKPGLLLTSDGVHMNLAGDRLMAAGILRAFGLDAAQIKKAEDAWLDIPGAVTLRGVVATTNNQRSLKASWRITLRQREKLETYAAGEKKAVDALAQEIFDQELKALLKPAGEYASVDAIYEAKKNREAQAQLTERFGKRIAELLAK